MFVPALTSFVAGPSAVDFCGSSLFSISKAVSNVSLRINFLRTDANKAKTINVTIAYQEDHTTEFLLKKYT